MRILISAFVAGVALLQAQPSLPPLLWAAWLVIPMALLLLLHSKRRFAALRWSCALLLAMGAGFFWAALIAQHRLADRLPDAWEGRDLRLIGVVAGMPQFTERGVRFEFDVEQVLTRAAKVPRHLSLVYYRETEESAGKDAANAAVQALFHAGERWQLTVRLKQPHGTANPHGFDFEAWALENNIRAVGNVRPDADNFRDSGSVWQPAYLIERTRERIRDRLASVLQNQPYAGVLTALAIGDQSAIPQVQWRTFWRTGVGHLISISGLHITMVGGLFSLLVYAVWRRSRWSLRLPARKPAALIGTLAALTYALLAGFSVPTQRTVYMLAVVAVAVLFDRTSSPSRVLLLALLLVTLIDPWAPLAAGFWLSFGAVAFILYLAAARTGKPGLLKSAFNTQLAVTLGLLPILLIFFQQISLISPLANVIAIPLVSLVVVPLTLLGVLPPLDFLLHLAHGLVGWLMVFLDFLAQLPSATWESGAPPTWAVVLGIAAVLWLLAPRGWPARWLGVLWLVPLLFPKLEIPLPGAAWATVLDVGQGLAVVVRTREHTLLYDTGPRWNEQADSGSRIVVPYLRGEGIKRLDGVVVTHADNDHSGGAISVLDAFPVDWLLSSLPSASSIVTLAPRSIVCYAGQRWQWDGVQFEVLHPALNSYADTDRKTNDRSCVLKVTASAGTLLLTGDIEARSENELLARDAAKLKADVLVVPHHGSRTSSTDAFVAAVKPAWVVYTVGYRNRFGHPRPDITARYEAIAAGASRSDRDGALLLRVWGSGTPPGAWRQVARRYWQD